MENKLTCEKVKMSFLIRKLLKLGSATKGRRLTWAGWVFSNCEKWEHYLDKGIGTFNPFSDMINSVGSGDSWPNVDDTGYDKSADSDDKKL